MGCPTLFNVSTGKDFLKPTLGKGGVPATCVGTIEYFPYYVVYIALTCGPVFHFTSSTIVFFLPRTGSLRMDSRASSESPFCHQSLS